MKKLYGFLILVVICVALLKVSESRAEMLFADNSLTVLRGHDYELGDRERTVLTYEHFSDHTWGNVFVFIDRLHSDNGDEETYMEIIPSLKLISFERGFIKALYLSGTVEFAEDFTNTLLGGAAALDLPGFRNFVVHFHAHEEGGLQITPVWAMPMSIGELELLYDGFIDYWFLTDDGSSSQFHFSSQFKINAARALGFEKRLYLGIEYEFWLNKFGIKDVNEKNLNALVKYHF